MRILYTEEDWRGKRAWENYKHEWEAKGEKFDWQAFVPPSVPDDQNFFTAPIFTNMLNGKIVMSPYGNDGGPDFRLNTKPESVICGVYRHAGITDLKAWQELLSPSETNTRQLANEISHRAATANAGERCVAGFEQIRFGG